MRSLAPLALSIAAALILTGCQAPSAASPSPTATASAATASGTQAASANAADVMFTQMMIPHHEQAVVMSDIILARSGVSAEVTALATRIKQAQQPEIDQMKAWLKAWGAEEGGMHAGHAGMGGMLSDADLQTLKDADGSRAQRLFLEGMIGHHEGAVTMAKEVLANGSDPAVKKMAESIITSQQAEITTMKKLLQA